MNQKRTILALVVLLLASSALAAPVAAQETRVTPDGQEDATPTPDESNDSPTLQISDGNTDVETYAQEIDSNLRLMEYDYDDDRDGFKLVFEADESTRITITEAVQFEEGAGSGRIYSNRVPSGVTEVFVPVQRRGGEAAVTMTTSESIDNNQFSYVSTGTYVDRPPISYEKVRILVGFTAVGAAAMTLRVVRKKRDDETKEAERIL